MSEKFPLDNVPSRVASKSLLLAVSAVVLAAILPLPTIGHSSNVTRAVVFTVVITIFFLPILGARYKPSAPNVVRYIRIGSVALPVISIFLLYLARPPLAISVILILSLSVLIALFRLYESHIPESGILGLLLTLGFIAAMELSLETIPKQYLITEVSATPPLLNWSDKGEQVFETSGFRGRNVCTNCEKPALRVFAMGGSSTFGIPMANPHNTYSAVLERYLKERNPNERVEVFNAGIPGYGVVQILDSLNRTILPRQPDIVMINAWFNDSGPGPGWYSNLGNSDLEGYFQMRFLRGLQEWGPYKSLHNTKCFAWFRVILLTAKDNALRFFPSEQKNRKAAKRRSTPEQFKTALTRIVELGRKYDFLPVFVLEPVNQTSDLKLAIQKNPYQAVMVDLARTEDVPVVDTLTPLQQLNGNWLFYDLVHTNENAHRVVAEAIYKDLFVANGQTSWGKRFFESRGIKSPWTVARRAPRQQLERDKVLDKDVCVQVRAPFRTDEAIITFINLDNEEFIEMPPLTEKFQTVKFRLPTDRQFRPLIEVGIRSRPNAVSERADAPAVDTKFLRAELVEIGDVAPCS